MAGKNPLLSLTKIQSAVESLIDRSSKIVDIATNAGVAYLGYNAMKHPVGALVGLIGLRLSSSPNLASGVAGVATLTGLGALNLIPPPTPTYRTPEDLLNQLEALGLWNRPTEPPYIRESGGGMDVTW